MFLYNTPLPLLKYYNSYYFDKFVSNEQNSLKIYLLPDITKIVFQFNKGLEQRKQPRTSTCIASSVFPVSLDIIHAGLLTPDTPLTKALTKNMTFNAEILLE